MHWIVNVGLSGIIGTLIALALAYWVLRRTLEHDRELAEETSFLADCRSAERDATELFNRLREGNAKPGGLPESELIAVTVGMWGLQTSVRHLAHRERVRGQQDIANLLDAGSATLIFTKVSDARVANCAQNLAEVLRWRVTDSDRLRSGSNYYEGMLESLEKGQAFSIG